MLNRVHGLNELHSLHEEGYYHLRQPMARPEWTVGDYLTDGTRLVQVVRVTSLNWVTEDCSVPVGFPPILVTIALRAGAEKAWRYVDVTAAALAA